VIKFLVRPGTFGAPERNFAALGEILGVGAATIPLPSDYAAGDSFVAELLSGGILICHAETIAKLLDKNCAGLASLDALARHLRSLLIYVASIGPRRSA
jgi:hypothetical protein